MTTRFHRLALLPALAAAALACGGEKRPPPNVISSEKFIAANVALRTVPDTVPDPAATRLARMGQQEVTPEQLQAFVDAHRNDLTYMAALWDTIARQVEMQNSVMERERNEARGRGEEVVTVDTGGRPLLRGPGGPADVTEELRRRRREPSAGMEVPAPPRPEPYRDELRIRQRTPPPPRP